MSEFDFVPLCMRCGNHHYLAGGCPDVEFPPVDGWDRKVCTGCEEKQARIDQLELRFKKKRDYQREYMREYRK